MLYINHTDRDITPLINQMRHEIPVLDEYEGNFTDLLAIAPHMAVVNINDFNKRQINLTLTYNDTMQHSIPIFMNILSNAYYR